MLENSFGLLFFLKQPKKPKKSGDMYVYLKITVDGIPKEVSTKYKWHPNRWDAKTGRAEGTKEDARTLNACLEGFVTQVYTARTYLINRDREITSIAIKDVMQGNTEENRYILQLFRTHNDEIEKQISDQQYSPGTLQKYNTVYDHTASFIKAQYKKVDLTLRDIDYSFVKDFSNYLKSEKHIGLNTTAKYISCLKTIVLDCFRRGWIKADPFAGYKHKRKEVIKVALNKDELARILAKEFVTDRLRLVRDIFLFSCYTGLAYSDVKKLNNKMIDPGFDGQQWLNLPRTKTDSPTRLPILPIAAKLMEKYSEHPKCLAEDTIMPIFSNQKMNEYLKEIAFLCGISKNLTYHLARHTFATTITLNNGVPIETVSKMLGHRSIKQTEQYARIQDHKVSEDMENLRDKISGEEIAGIDKIYKPQQAKEPICFPVPFEIIISKAV